MSLTGEQFSNLIQQSERWLKSLTVENTDFDLGEVPFTARVLFPALKSHVSTMLKPELYVRGDGGSEVPVVLFEGISLYPDLAIVSLMEKYIAFEVKVLRDQDPGGALTKAVGQTLIYGTNGYQHSFGLIFDARGKKLGSEICSWNHQPIRTENSSVHYFK